MQKLGLNQSLQQKLSPQQIQFIKLLQVPTAELETRIGPVTLPAVNFTAGRPKSGDAVKLCIRPEHFRAAGDAASTRLGEAEITEDMLELKL